MSLLEPDQAALARRLLTEVRVGPDSPHFAEGLVGMAFLHGRAHALARVTGLRFCRVCGCTDDAACQPGSCFWVEADLCSACQPFVGAPG